MSANATEVAAYRDLYYKKVDERDNPIMWTIEYHRGYPYRMVTKNIIGEGVSV